MHIGLSGLQQTRIVDWNIEAWNKMATVLQTKFSNAISRMQIIFRNIPGKLGQYHGCWCHVSPRHQVINKPATDYAG